MSARRHTAFAVVYQWRVKVGMEAQFVNAWQLLTRLLREQRGARGSRLHRTEQGTLVAYAQWPDRVTWERSCGLHELDAELSRQMLDAVEDTWPPMLLDSLCDELMPENAENGIPDGATH